MGWDGGVSHAIVSHVPPTIMYLSSSAFSGEWNGGCQPCL